MREIIKTELQQNVFSYISYFNNWQNGACL